ncbi:hypothetical protein J2T58_002249 [Methanocalculus alkaliphilus]|nr:hypothetical protein [Methanocalculus alkaliphilus]MCP1716372.1 hypothetical protein [Methanocalculus alkaliphilus]
MPILRRDPFFNTGLCDQLRAQPGQEQCAPLRVALPGWPQLSGCWYQDPV